MGMLQLFQDCGAIIREIAGRVKRILDMPAMFVWYFKEENTLRFWRLCGRIEKTRRKETAVTLQQLRYVTAVAGTGTISRAVQQFYISQPSLTNAIRELAAQNQFDQVVPYHSTEIRCQQSFELCEFSAQKFLSTVLLPP